MAVLIKEPTNKAPWPPLRSNDKLYRYPKPYPVGQVKGESFSTIAKQHKLGAVDLLRYNFQARDPAYINWYLANYVRCPPPGEGRSNFDFLGAPQDANALSGLIFIPTHGEPTSNALNRLGAKLVEFYNNTWDKEPLALCYETCHFRVNKAAAAIGVALPAWSDNSVFGAMWGSLIAQPAWKDVPDFYKGLGAAGAMIWAGHGTLVSGAGVWNGELEPGAVIQVWGNDSDYKNVKKGKPAYGHSFIFLNYVYAGSNITGMAIADQGYQNGEPVGRGAWGVWFGANLYQKAAREPNTVRYGPNP